MHEVIIKREDSAGHQVFRADSESELIDKLRDAHTNATAKIREQSQQIDMLVEITVLVDARPQAERHIETESSVRQTMIPTLSRSGSSVARSPTVMRTTPASMGVAEEEDRPYRRGASCHYPWSPSASTSVPCGQPLHPTCLCWFASATSQRDR